MKDEIYEKVVDILLRYSKRCFAADQVTQETHLLLDMNINSARLVDITLDFEDEFGIQIRDDEADEIYTVGKAVGLVKAKKTKHEHAVP